MIDREEYVQKLKARLDEWNIEAAKWEAKAKTAQADMRAEYERQLALYRQRRDEGLRRMNEIQAASGDAWVEIMRGADDAWKRMQDAFDQARSKLGK
jgi:chromosome segregation ATPase